MQVAIRVDAFPEMGTGHAMRCLTLATSLREAGARVRFVTRRGEALSVAQVSELGCEFVQLPPADVPASGDLAHWQWLAGSQAQDARDTIDALADSEWDWVVVDHYGLDARWESAVRMGGRVVVIDDLADRVHDADVLLDQNLHPEGPERYRDLVAPACRVLSGPRFALLRPEFALARAEVGVRQGPVRRVLVCFGGSDSANHTAAIVEALGTLSSWSGEVDVVIGAGHVDKDGVSALCARHGFTLHVQTRRLAGLLARTDLAIGAGGSTVWERCCLGVPTLMQAVADNQSTQVREVAMAGAASAPDAPDWPRSFERHFMALVHNEGLRGSLSRRGMDLVDGRGAARVVQAMGVNRIVIRPATGDDSEQIFSWRNQPRVRDVSRTTAPLDRAAHERWMAGVLVDPARRLLIGQHGEVPVGVVRFDLSDGGAEVSIYLTPGPHPRGTGGVLLDAAEQWLQRDRPDIHHVRAVVLGDNHRSHKLFLNGGYQRLSSYYEKLLQVKK